MSTTTTFAAQKKEAAEHPLIREISLGPHSSSGLQAPQLRDPRIYQPSQKREGVEIMGGLTWMTTHSGIELRSKTPKGRS